MSDQTVVWLILAGAAMLAGLVLWLRDRFRDLRHVPEAERKLAEQKSAVGAKGFLSFFFMAACVVRAIAIPTFVPRVCYFLGAFLFAWTCFQCYRSYRMLGAKTKTSTHLADHDGGAM
ncbi:MAG: hypothetical protein WA744_09110 [Candidatus Acidiferrales bacterium]